MAIVRSELCMRDDGKSLNAYETSKWRVLSLFEDNIDASQYQSGCDIATELGNRLMQHLNHPQNPMGLKRIIGGPSYTYGQTSATATIYFEGNLTSSQSACMRLSSRCEWMGDKPVA